MNRAPGATSAVRWACDACGESSEHDAHEHGIGVAPAIAGMRRDSILPRLCERCLSEPGAVDEAAENIRARGWEDGRDVERDAVRFARRHMVTLPVVVVR